MELFEPAVWGIIMLGAGVILLVEALIRLLVPQFHRHLGGTLVVAAIFIAIGLGNIFQNWTSHLAVHADCIRSHHTAWRAAAQEKIKNFSDSSKPGKSQAFLQPKVEIS